MSIPPPYRLVTVPESRMPEVVRLDTWAFPTEHTPETLAQTPPPLPWGERTFGVEREGSAELVAFHAAYGLRAYPVPGAEVACGWLTWVGVHPGHRRRGILRGMIQHHFADALGHGEALSALTASEPGIYGRFGYGLAAPVLSLTIPRGAALRPVPGTEAREIELAEWDPARHGDLVASIHRAYARLPAGLGRPGWATRETPALRRDFGADPEALRSGKEAQRVLIVRDESGSPTGYALFRRSVDWADTGPSGTVAVREAVALDPASTHRMWSVLADLDLSTKVTIANLPTDEAITRLLVDLRAASPRYVDHTWIRLLDVPLALTQRRYAGDVDVVLEVTDGLIPANAGRWHVRAGAFGYAEVVRTEADPDLVLDVRELGAAHLGSVSLAVLAQAGLVEAHSPRALAAASVAWSWPIAAGASWIF